MPHKTLIIAEKPSVARDLASTLGVTRRGDNCLYNEAYTITWCFGHLVELVNPVHYDESWGRWDLSTLPLLPSPFALQPTESGQEQYARLRAWLLDETFSCVINACDAGREGELIFGYVYELSTSTLPVKRLWIASMTQEAIREGFTRLGEGRDYVSLYESARARSQADWLVGLNATRLITLLARDAQPQASVPTLSVGRVQTPTLALIVSRDLAREAFTPSTTWGMRAEFSTAEGHVYEGVAHDPHLAQPFVWHTREEAEQKLTAFTSSAGERAQVTAFESTAGSRQAPQFFDLTSLQRDANTRHGFSAQHTLDLAQALYERHKVLTYPRTDSKHITQDIAHTLGDRIKTLHDDPVFGELARTLVIDVATLSKRLVNAEKVSDHHALLPTNEPVAHKALSDDERTLYEMVCRRMMAALAHPPQIQRTSLTTTWGTLTFLSRGTQLVSPGWLAFEKEEQENGEDASALPGELALHALVSPVCARHLPSTTRAPARLTEASLLLAMETVGKSLEDDTLGEMLSSSGGLGTPATRAATIEVLLRRGYVVRQGRHLEATPVGRALIHALSAFPSVTSAEMTGQWERALELIVEGRLSARTFMEKIELLVQGIVLHFKAHPPHLNLPEPEAFAACPACARSLFLSDKVVWCQGRKTDVCTFMVFRKIAGKTLTENQMKKLVTQRKTPVLKGFKSRKGDSFAAALHLEEGTWKVAFSFDDSPQSKEASS